jgi:hypothetical protein
MVLPCDFAMVQKQGLELVSQGLELVSQGLKLVSQGLEIVSQGLELEKILQRPFPATVFSCSTCSMSMNQSIHYWQWE